MNHKQAIGNLVLCVSLFLCDGAALAKNSVLIDSLARWSEISVRDLHLEGSPKPQRAVFAIMDQQEYRILTSFGDLMSEWYKHSRPGRVEIVVGDNTLNSSRFRGQLPSSITRPLFVVDDVAIAIERDLWLATDTSYKSAIKRWQVKQSILATQGGDKPPAEWSAAPSINAIDKSKLLPVDRTSIRDLVLDASKRFRDVKSLRKADVQAYALEAKYHLVTSEGTRLVQPEGFVVLYAWADQLRSDGVRVFDQLHWVVRRASDLPSKETLAQAVSQLAQSISARAQAPLVEYYEGPVLFENEAAAEFFIYLLSSEFSGTPPAPNANTTYKKRIRSGPRIGRRLLPKGWTVWDDPGQTMSGKPGGYVYDREGVRGRKVMLVKDGYVHDLLMSRVPRHNRSQSNGHARGSILYEYKAMPSIWTVKPRRLEKSGALRKRAKRAMRAARLDRILVVSRLALGSKRDNLPRPTQAYWLLKNGRQEPVLSLSFQKSDRRILRDIVAASGKQTYSYLIGGRIGGVPAVALTPRMILVQDVECAFPGPDEKPSLYAAPAL